MEPNTVQSIIEAVIFVSDKPVTIKELESVVNEATKIDIQRAIEKLKTQYKAAHHGISLELVAGGYHFRTKIDKANWMKRLTKMRPVKMTRSQLETLSIVAYKQPVTRVEVDSVRGVDSSHLLKMLLDRKMVRIQGVKEAPGRPLIYGTTDEFLEFFGLSGVDKLPSLEELKELHGPRAPEMPLFENTKFQEQSATLDEKDLLGKDLDDPEVKPEETKEEPQEPPKKDEEEPQAEN